MNPEDEVTPIQVLTSEEAEVLRRDWERKIYRECEEEDRRKMNLDLHRMKGE